MKALLCNPARFAMTAVLARISAFSLAATSCFGNNGNGTNFCARAQAVQIKLLLRTAPTPSSLWSVAFYLPLESQHLRVSQQLSIFWPSLLEVNRTLKSETTTLLFVFTRKLADSPAPFTLNIGLVRTKLALCRPLRRIMPLVQEVQAGTSPSQMGI